MFNFSTAQIPLLKRKKAVPDTDGVDTKATALAMDGTLKLPWYRRLSKLQIGLLAGVIILLTALITIGIFTYVIAKNLSVQAREAEFTAMEAYDAFKGQNLPLTEEKLLVLDAQLQDFTTTYKQLSFYKFVPFAKTYYLDGEHGLKAAAAGMSAGEKAIAAITPYADVLGFTGEDSFEGGTTEDRIKVILDTIDLVMPVFNDMTADLQIMEQELLEIDPNDYPESLAGKPVRQYVEQVHELASGAVTAVTEYRPVIEQIPYVAGANGETRKYLILFQNDNELRPTGGFLTAYAIINVTDGKVEAQKSDDIYELDQKFRANLPIPEKLGRYLTSERYWNLRDMNVSPDFKSSMDTFFENYQNVPGEPSDEIDGIIAVDTHFLTNLLTVLGPVAVPGYGTFSSEIDPRCDCPQIIYVLSEIITRPTPYMREDRKGILGPLMSAILSKAYGAPKQQWPDLFATGFASVQNKHAQFYFLNDDIQKAAETVEVAGRMLPVENSDFLAIINSNLAGAKSNLFINYDVKQTVAEPESGYITKTVEITYRNTRRADNCNLEAGLLCLNATLRDWTRIYVPAGSELIQAQGFSEEPETYEESGFTVFDGFFTLEPLAQAKLVLTYKVPYLDTQNYRLQIWKQGGIESYKSLLDVTGGQEEVWVEKDTTYQVVF